MRRCVSGHNPREKRPVSHPVVLGSYLIVTNLITRPISDRKIAGRNLPAPRQAGEHADRERKLPGRARETAVGREQVLLRQGQIRLRPGQTAGRTGAISGRKTLNP